jgi:alkanesulfonate monooxygenase SsuD/methylene tetrahydromethanopterin reductase-like flavin-dependent oxidoreductase (luciferase family)
VAELYPARLTIGLGHGMAGWMRQIGAYPRSPLTALAEHIQAIRALLAGESVSIDHVILGFPAGITPDRQDRVSRQLITAAAGRLP